MSENVRVDILGDVYNLKVTEGKSKEDLERVIAVFKNRLNSIRMKFPLLTEKKLLVLLSLNLTEELLYEKDNSSVSTNNRDAFYRVLRDIEKLIKTTQPPTRIDD